MMSPSCPETTSSLTVRVYGVYRSTWPTASMTPAFSTAATIRRQPASSGAIGFSSRM